MATVSTHVLDTTRGLPAVGVEVFLEGDGAIRGRGVTDSEGRIRSIGPQTLQPGDYVLRFAVGEYHRSAGQVGFYPVVRVDFTISDPDAHHHVPLLLSPFGYSTYRGS